VLDATRGRPESLLLADGAGALLVWGGGAGG